MMEYESEEIYDASSQDTLKSCDSEKYSPDGRLLKRGTDIIIAFMCMVICIPIFAILIALFFAWEGRSPIFFGHRRVGRHGKSFKCWKFRTMVVDAENRLDDYLHRHPHARDEWMRSQKLRFDPRITPIGLFLRRTNLDELPQIWNVIVGDMSLVGPRPVTEYEMDVYYGSSAPLVTSAAPGITGPWQISPNRNDIDFDQRVSLDVEYVRSQTMIGDILILIKTLPVLVKNAMKSRKSKSTNSKE